MVDNEHVFAVNLVSGQLTLILFKLNLENGSFQIKCELVDDRLGFYCDSPILRSHDYLLVIMLQNENDEIRCCSFKFKLKNVYAIKKYHDVRAPAINLFCNGLFEDKLLFFEYLATENITKTLYCLDLKTEKVNKFDLELPDAFEQVGFVVTLTSLTHDFRHLAG